MKYIMAVLLSLSLVGCGTLGGAMQGAGEDLSRAGDYVKKVGK
jgi:predicted small secreted protein